MKPTPSSRYQTRSMTRALGRGLPSSVSWSAGPTAALNNNCLISGDQTGFEAPCCMKVNLRASPPSAGISQTWGLPLPCFFCSLSSLPLVSPSRSETKANQRPSGDHAGLYVLAGPVVKRFAASSGNYPDGGTVFVLTLVDRGDDKGYALAIGGDARPAEKFELIQVFNCD